MLIRPEKEEDYRAVEELTRETFWNLYEPGCYEHYNIYQTRKSQDFIPELSLVVEQNNRLIAHILYSRSKIAYSDGKQLQAITFGPVSVDSQLQKKGIGSLLIKESIGKAKALGYKAIVITGHPSVYHRFGFKNSHQYSIHMDFDYPVGLMVLELSENYLPKDIEGSIFFAQGSIIFNMPQFQEYDKSFPQKQKFFTKSQYAFNKLMTTKWNQPYDASLKEIFNKQKSFNL